MAFLLGCRAPVGARGTPLRKPRGPFHDVRAPYCIRWGLFHAARPSVVHSEPLGDFSGPLSGSRDPLREPRPPMLYGPLLCMMVPSWGQVPAIKVHFENEGPCWTKCLTTGLKNGLKKYRLAKKWEHFKKNRSLIYGPPGKLRFIRGNLHFFRFQTLWGHLVIMPSLWIRQPV